MSFVRDRLTWLAYLMLAYFAYLQASLGPLMPFLRAELGLSYTVGGLHFSALALGMAVAGLTGDPVVQRWGRRVAFWGGGLGMAAGALGLAWGRHVFLTVTSAFAMGVGGAFLLMMIQAVLSDRHGERRAIALTEANVAASVGAGLSPLAIGGLQRTGVGWRGALYLAVGILALIATGASFAGIRVPVARRSDTGSSRTVRALPAAFWAYWAVIFLCVSVEWCLVVWGSDFLENVVGLTRADAASMMSVFFAAMVLGRILGSRFSRVARSEVLLLIALGIGLVGFPIFWLASFAPLNVVGLFIVGFGVANFYPLAMSAAIGTASGRADAASARISLAVGLSTLILPLLLGWTADRLGIGRAYGIVIPLLVAATAVTVCGGRAQSPARP